MKNKKVCDGFEIQSGEDGHWLCFESNGKSAMINVENKTGGIVKDAIVGWINDNLEEKEIEMKEKIAKLEKELAALKEQCGKYEPKVGNWAVSGMGRIEHIQALRNWYLTAGRLFDTEEKAEKARDIMIKHDIILKYVIDHAPDWNPDWDDYAEQKWGVFYGKDRHYWLTNEIDACNSMGTIVMPEWVAEKLADDLNNNRIDLEPHKNV